MDKKRFYRVGIVNNNNTGLWYNQQGEFTGLIHEKFEWLGASKLEMPYDTEIVGYLSVADSMQHLYQWFTKDEILKLQECGYAVFEYVADDYKFYNLYQHNVINAQTSIVNNIIILNNNDNI
jgi:hypothetical protein